MLPSWLTITLAAALAQPPPPPYVRQKTVMVYGSAYDPAVCVDGSVLYTGEGETCFAFALPSLDMKWSLKLPGGETVGELTVAGGTVYLVSDPSSRGAKSHLHALDARTGRIRWSLPRTGDASPIGVGRDVLYLAMAPHSVSAVDRKTRAVRWRRTFPTGKEGFSVRSGVGAITASGAYVLVNSANVTYCLQASSGRELWRQGESYVLSSGLPVLAGVAAVPAGEGMAGRDVSSGKVLWKKPTVGLSDGARTLGRHFVGIHSGQLRAIEPRTGRVVWSKVLDPKRYSGGNQYVSVLGNRIFARGNERAGVFDGAGRTQSSGSAELALPEPFWTDGTSLVCFDGSRLLAYRRGREAPPARDAAARKRLAIDLVRRFATLDKTEIARLVSLGDEAFEPVLTALRAACAAYDAGGKRRDSYPLYRRYQDLAEVLGKVTTAKRTGALLGALREEKKSSSARPTLLELSARVGDPAVVTPYFLEELKDLKTPGFELYESASYVARRYIVRSRDPRAVAFLTRELQNPEGDPVLRFEAYLHLAGSGDPDAVKAVLAERSRRSLLRPLEERVLGGVLNAGEFGTRMKVLAEKEDRKGRTWGLLQSGVLGSAGDLWLAEKVGGFWTRPLFSGVSSAPVSSWAKPAPPEPRIGGKTGKELAAGAWFDVLVSSPEIRRDSDGDGLTDLVETRLGTDPGRRDSDGDGDPDGTDPWPNAAPRALSDEEKVYAAVFEARFHFNDSEGPALLSAPGKLKPFEMPGRRGPVLWVPEEGRRQWSHPLEHHYEQGVAFIGFAPADRERPGREVIRWNKQRTEAKLTISVYFGGLNGTGYTARVRKIGEEWVVVAMEMAYVS